MKMELIKEIEKDVDADILNAKKKHAYGLIAEAKMEIHHYELLCKGAAEALKRARLRLEELLKKDLKEL